MKRLEYYMNLPYHMELVPDIEEGGYAVRFPELPGCLTVGDTVEEASQNALDAKRAWLKAALEDSIEIAEPASTQHEPNETTRTGIIF